jgi:hypothetical protein
MTHYQVPRPRGSDIMAANFVWRILERPYLMEQGLADCNADPNIPCVDSVAALSDVDMGKVYDVRFVRTPAPGEFEISKVVRVVSVDSGHSIQTQATLGPNETGTPMLRTNQSTGPRMLWRFEIGGQMAEQLGAGGGSLAGLVRWSHTNDKTIADKPKAGSCTDFNHGEWKCTEADGVIKTVKCMDFRWQQFTSGCKIPGKPNR